MLLAIPTINAQLSIKLGLNELLSLYYCKFFEQGSFGLALHDGLKRLVDEVTHQSEIEWLDELIRILGWQTPARSGGHVLRALPQEI